MNCKIVTYWDGVLHILRNPYGFTEETIREARLAAADRIECLSEVSQVEQCLRELLDASYGLSAYLLKEKSVMVTEAFAIATENARVLLTKETK